MKEVFRDPSFTRSLIVLPCLIFNIKPQFEAKHLALDYMLNVRVALDSGNLNGSDRTTCKDTGPIKY